MKNVCLLFHNKLLKQIYVKKKKKTMEYVENKYTRLKHFSKKKKKLLPILHKNFSKLFINQFE